MRGAKKWFLEKQIEVENKPKNVISRLWFVLINIFLQSWERALVFLDTYTNLRKIA